MSNVDLEALRLLNVEQILSLVPVSKMTIMRMVGRGDFPEPTKIGQRLFWRYVEVKEWLADKSGPPPKPNRDRRSDLV